MAYVWFSLGSNAGDSWSILATAVNALTNIGELTCVSSLYITKAVEDENQDNFHNIVLRMQTNLNPFSVFNKVVDIERSIGRIRDPARPKGPRNIDIDILLYDKILLDSDKLMIPHPRMHLRNFVLSPLLEIDPDIVDPRNGKPFTQYYTSVKQQGIYAVYPATYNDAAIWKRL